MEQMDNILLGTEAAQSDAVPHLLSLWEGEFEDEEGLQPISFCKCAENDRCGRC
jgi:hypothetical protein